MRIALAAVLWIVLVGGLFAFLAANAPIEPAPAQAHPAAPGSYTVELTASFALGPDPFALEPSAAGLTRLLRGRARLSEAGPRAAGEPLLAALDGLQAGRNELFVRAAPPLAAGDRAHALRVVLRRGAEIVAERTFWSEPGGPLAGTLAVELPGTPARGRP